MTRRKHWYEGRAWLDGWEIETQHDDGKWTITTSPSFYDNSKYRVVPDSEGWLPWYEAGPAPVPKGTLVEFKWPAVGVTVESKTTGNDWTSGMNFYRIIKEEVDPYAELKAAAKDPTKQIRVKGGSGWWDSGDINWVWNAPVENYEIRDKPCECGDRAIKHCPGKWEKGCDLGANEKFVDVVKPKTKKVKLLAWLTHDGMLMHRLYTLQQDWKRVPSEDKEIEVEL